MAIILLPCFFYQILQPKLLNFLCNRFYIISKNNNLLVHYINVGQGDAMVITLPDNKNVFIDCGLAKSSTTYVNYIDENVMNSMFNNKIDYLILTHTDSDHTGGTMRLLQDYNIGKVYLPQLIGEDNTSYPELEECIKSNYTYETITSGVMLESANYKIEIMGPLSTASTNDNCPIIKLTAYDKTFLFAGDISSKTEKLFINTYGEDLNCDILKVAHHGAKSSTSEEFLNITTPDIAIISVGKNSYSHPSAETLTRLNSAGVDVLTTIDNGNILVVVGDTYGTRILRGDFYVTNSSLDYRIVILVVEIVVLGKTILVLVLKRKPVDR